VTGINDGRLRELVGLRSALGAMAQRLAGLVPDLRFKGDAEQPSGHLGMSARRMKSGVGRNSQTIDRPLMIGGVGGVPAHLYYYDGLVDDAQISQTILPALLSVPKDVLGQVPPADRHLVMQAAYLPVGSVETSSSWSSALAKLAAGNMALLVEGDPTILLVDVAKIPHRSVNEPETEQVLLGPREGFTDLLFTNLALVRRRIGSPSLRVRSVTRGKITRTEVAVLWIEGVTNRRLVARALHRIRRFEGDMFLYQSDVRTVLEDRPKSLFPLVRTTERVDEVIRALAMGKIAVLLDGTPAASLVPATFTDFYQTTQDYVSSFWDTSLVRVIRAIGWFLSLYSPGIYVALTAVNPDLVPSKLLLSLAGAHEGVPFVPLVEVVIMFVVIEILREAALRLPTSLGQTLGTVGAIVVGEAMIRAGIVSSTMIIVVTVTALATFTVPSFEMTAPWRILLWVMIASAEGLGLAGLLLASAVLITRLVSLTSLGVPYMAPFGPLRPRDLKDSVVRFPVEALKRRPSSLEAVATAKGPFPRPDPAGGQA